MSKNLTNKIAESYSERLAEEYESLLNTSHCSETGEHRIQEILNAAIYSEELNSLIRAVDNKHASNLGSFSNEDIQIQKDLLPNRLDSIDNKLKKERKEKALTESAVQSRPVSLRATLLSQVALIILIEGLSMLSLEAFTISRLGILMLGIKQYTKRKASP